MADDPGDVREERRVVSALFADIVGSTTLGERLDPEDLKLIVADAITRMIDAVETFGGTVKDLAGDGMLALFGAPVAHEDDPERAIYAALRILEDIAEFAAEVERGWGVQDFGVRCAVSTPGWSWSAPSAPAVGLSTAHSVIRLTPLPAFNHTRHPVLCSLAQRRIASQNPSSDG